MHNEPYVRTAKLVSPLKETTRPDCEYLLSPVAVSGFAYDIMIFTYLLCAVGIYQSLCILSFTNQPQ